MLADPPAGGRRGSEAAPSAPFPFLGAAARENPLDRLEELHACVVVRVLEERGDPRDERRRSLAAERRLRAARAAAGGRGRSRPASRSVREARARRPRTADPARGRAPTARPAPARRGGAGTRRCSTARSRSSARARAEKRGSDVRSSTTSGCRVTSAKPAIPVLDGKRVPTRVSPPCPETASKTSSSALLVVEEDRRRLGARRSCGRRRRSTGGAPGRSPRLRRACRPRRLRERRARRSCRASVFVAVRCRTLFSWNGVSSGCFASTSAATPATCGAAKLLPVQRSVPPPSHATSTSTPRAKSSTGRARVDVPGERVRLLVAADRDHRREPPRVAVDRQVVRRGDDRRCG